MIWFVLYVASIVAANVLIVTVGVVPVGLGLLAPAGVYAAGLSFALRDAVQERMGRGWTVAAIVVGAAISALLSPGLAVASGLAFLVSEMADMAVYTPLRARGLVLAVVASNVAGSLIDSVLFLALAFGSLDFLAGNVVGKWLTVLPVVAGMWLWRRRCCTSARSLASS